jgi:hypothetical protein
MVMVPFSDQRGFDPKHPNVLPINPKGHIPVLVHDDLEIRASGIFALHTIVGEASGAFHILRFESRQCTAHWPGPLSDTLLHSLLV